MTTLTARAAMVINKLADIGPCYASDLAAAEAGKTLNQGEVK